MFIFEKKNPQTITSAHRVWIVRAHTFPHKGHCVIVQQVRVERRNPCGKKRKRYNARFGRRQVMHCNAIRAIVKPCSDPVRRLRLCVQSPSCPGEKHVIFVNGFPVVFPTRTAVVGFVIHARSTRSCVDKTFISQRAPTKSVLS